TAPHMSTPEGGFSGGLGRVQLGRVGASPGHDRRSTAGAECDRLLRRVAAGKPEREAGREAVAAAVGVHDGARHGRRPKRTPRLDPAAEPTGRRDDDVRRRLELAGAVELALVLPAADEGVELDAGLAEG